MSEFQKLEKVLAEKNISKNALALKAGISPADLYQAIGGKKPFFPAWRKRIAEALEMTEEELFYCDTEAKICICPRCNGTGKILL